MSGPVFHVEKMVHGGFCIVHDRDRALLVRGVIPGEQVNVRILPGTGTPKAEPLEIVSASPERREPPCPLFGKCGGCHLQHISYPLQAVLKKEAMEETIARIAGIETTADETITAAPPLYYRSRVRLQVKGGKAGFFRAGGRDLVEVGHCLLAREPLNLRLSDLAALIKKDKPESIELIEDERGDVVAVSRKGGKKRTYVYSEEAGWVSEPCRKIAFQQVNPEQNLRLIETVAAIAEKAAPALALELYAGDGNLTRGIAPFCGRVRAADSDPAAVELAGESLCKYDNVKFERHSAHKLVDDSLRQGERPDLVLLDPPRKGAREVIPGLVRLDPQYVVYVSCDPPALARDIKDLAAAGYRLENIHPLDMFPQTYHLEVVALLVKKG